MFARWESFDTFQFTHAGSHVFVALRMSFNRMVLKETGVIVFDANSVVGCTCHGH